MKNNKLWILVAVILFLLGIAGSFFLFGKPETPQESIIQQPAERTLSVTEDYSYLRIYYPFADRLELVEKRLPKRTKEIAIAEAIIEEFFRGPEDNGEISIPRDVRLLGLYKDPYQILYIDLSDELRRNFSGDALSEYLILKGLFESLLSNLEDFSDFKIIVEGKEIESFGGHIYLNLPLGSVISREIKEE